MDRQFDIIVVGGGHAGVEAAAAAARLGAKTLLISMKKAEIARMSCNPAMGGLGKGHLVREIDALDGIMGLASDANGLQFRMLNMGKGPAVRAPRAQMDKMAYPRWMVNHLENYSEHLKVAEGTVIGLEQGDQGFRLKLEGAEEVEARAVVITAGTFLDGLIHLGMEHFPGGRWGDPPADGLARSLERLGLETLRLKTGTPARLLGKSIAWEKLEEQKGDEPVPPFSYLTARPLKNRLSCHITYTNPRTHAIIREAMDRSPLYTGIITGVGPRYCPSIETKLIRFEGRDRHQVFLEPESLENDLVYVNGVSTSLPPDTQDAFLRTIAGLEKVEIARYGYGIEYIAFPPTQLRPTLECLEIPGLYLAGQVNGTTGYEEAAGLGLVAGANAALKVQNRDALTFRRDEAYLGVMIDDLITKGAPEPYRLFTSRAEYRLLLRQDNADLRLTEKGWDFGLVGERRWGKFQIYRTELEKERERLRETRLRPKDLDERAWEDAGLPALKEGLTLEQLLARPQVHYGQLKAVGLQGEGLSEAEERLAERVREEAQIQVKYAGFIERQTRQLARSLGLEKTPLPEETDFFQVPSLRHEAAQMLEERKPATLGHASRLPGVNPSDISALLIYLKGRQETLAKRGPAE